MENRREKDTIKVGSEIAKSLEPTLASFSREEMISKMKSDPSFLKATKDLSLTDEEIKEYFPLVYSFYSDLLICSKCPGYDSCPKEIPQTMSQLRKDSFGFLDRSFGPCSIRAKKEKLESAYIVRDIGEEAIDADVSSNNLDLDSMNLFTSLGLALNGGSKPWVFVHGEEGSGKTYAIASFSNFMAAQGASVAFLDTAKRLDELKGLAINNKQRFDNTMRMYETCDILVLDNFGSEFKSEYLRDQILLPLLSYRSSKRGMVVFSSSFSLKEIITLYSSVGPRASGMIQGKVLQNLFNKNIEKTFECALKVESLFTNKRKTFKGI